MRVTASDLSMHKPIIYTIKYNVKQVVNSSSCPRGLHSFFADECMGTYLRVWKHV